MKLRYNVNPDRGDLNLTTLLSVIGQVDPPSSSALAGAREMLWSAVTEEMLATSDVRAKPTELMADQPQKAARRRRPDGSRQDGQRRNGNTGK